VFIITDSAVGLPVNLNKTESTELAENAEKIEEELKLG
jgi:hypothetical protein